MDAAIERFHLYVFDFSDSPLRQASCTESQDSFTSSGANADRWATVGHGARAVETLRGGDMR